MKHSIMFLNAALLFGGRLAIATQTGYADSEQDSRTTAPSIFKISLKTKRIFNNCIRNN